MHKSNQIRKVRKDIWAYKAVLLIKMNGLTNVDFLLPGREFFVALAGKYDLPSEPGRRLYLIKDGRFVREVRVPKDLIGHVSLISPELALHFVRLFSLAETFYIMKKPHWIEIVPESKARELFPYEELDEQIAYHLKIHNLEADELKEMARQCEIADPKELLTALGTGTKYRYWGIVTDAEWQGNELKSPEIEEIAEGFIFRRMLYQPLEDSGWATKNAYWVEERVSPRGEVKKKRLLGKIEMKGNIELTIGRYK